jgi:hypothetical protein
MMDGESWGKRTEQGVYRRLGWPWKEPDPAELTVLYHPPKSRMIYAISPSPDLSTIGEVSEPPSVPVSGKSTQSQQPSVYTARITYSSAEASEAAAEAAGVGCKCC